MLRSLYFFEKHAFSAIFDFFDITTLEIHCSAWNVFDTSLQGVFTDPRSEI
jgi:hypothetical protein